MQKLLRFTSILIAIFTISCHYSISSLQRFDSSGITPNNSNILLPYSNSNGLTISYSLEKYKNSIIYKDVNYFQLESVSELEQKYPNSQFSITNKLIDRWNNNYLNNKKNNIKISTPNEFFNISFNKYFSLGKYFKNLKSKYLIIDFNIKHTNMKVNTKKSNSYGIGLLAKNKLSILFLYRYGETIYDSQFDIYGYRHSSSWFNNTDYWNDYLDYYNFTNKLISNTINISFYYKIMKDIHITTGLYLGRIHCIDKLDIQDNGNIIPIEDNHASGILHAVHTSYPFNINYGLIYRLNNFFSLLLSQNHIYIDYNNIFNNINLSISLTI